MYENRSRFKSYINKLAVTKAEGDEKVILLNLKYSSYDTLPSPASHNSVFYSPQHDPRNSVGLPLSPAGLGVVDSSVSSPSTPSRQPPPYRAPPPPPSSASMNSLDTMSLGSTTSLNDLQKTPQPPPREKRKDSENRNFQEDGTPQKTDVDDPNVEDKTISVKERTQKFNRLASVDDELSPRPPKSAEKKSRGADEDDGVSLTPIDPKKCVEWYVTASRGDYQELLKLANTEPRLVNKKVTLTLEMVLLVA
ncbi:uncharacterized protein LOC114328338 [Diabrotica virgifera virgifera]|uniref:Uncharacterized protein n=1 Tax=Diabrotica virgifera virgifera TaxID=50390 RepID=A0ABM5KRQ8_DIAVI|nr:uncharacterized protein LOC114328338 [Diabrotica virgifera virgifera]